jgi:hypothetical protein
MEYYDNVVEQMCSRVKKQFSIFIKNTDFEFPKEVDIMDLSVVIDFQPNEYAVFRSLINSSTCLFVKNTAIQYLLTNFGRIFIVVTARNYLFRTFNQKSKLISRSMFIVIQKDVEFLDSIIYESNEITIMHKFALYMRSRSIINNDYIFDKWAEDNKNSLNQTKKINVANENLNKRSCLIELKELELSKQLSEIDQLKSTYNRAILGIEVRKTIDDEKKELLELADKINSAVDIFSFDEVSAKSIISTIRSNNCDCWSD